MTDKTAIHGMGMGSFFWWEGVVEDRQDPLQMGRVRVRISGWHTHLKTEQDSSKNFIRSEDLPWALVMMPTTSAGMHGIGDSVPGLVEGSVVVGYFRDGHTGQEPVVMGVIQGVVESVQPLDIPNASNINKSGKTRDEKIGFYDPRTQEQLKTAPRPPLSLNPLTEQESAVHYPHDLTAKFETRNGTHIGETDVHRLAKGIPIGTCQISKMDTAMGGASGVKSARFLTPIVGGEVFSEPTPRFGQKYPYNKVTESESGHVHEVDDTPGAERLHTFHRTGSFDETHPDGTKVSKSVANRFDRTIGDHRILAEGSYSLMTNGKYRIQQSDCVIEIIDGHIGIVGANIHAYAKESMTFESLGTTNIFSAGDINVETVGDFNLTAKNLNRNIINKIDTLALEIVDTSTSHTQKTVMLSQTSTSHTVLTTALSVGFQTLSIGGEGISMSSAVSNIPLDFAFSAPVTSNFSAPVSQNYAAPYTATGSQATLTFAMTTLNGAVTMPTGPVLINGLNAQGFVSCCN